VEKMKPKRRIDRSRRRDRVSDRGASMTEFALVLPFLFVVLFTIFEFGIAFNRAQAVQAAAREGGRLASLSSTSVGDVQNRVTATLAGMPMDSAVNTAVNPNPAVCTNREGLTVTVTVTTTHNVDIPFLAPIVVPLSGTAVFRCEA